MAFDIQWRSQHGNRTNDNRDYAGIGIRDNSILSIVLDGSTSGQASGALAREIAVQMIDWFITECATITINILIEKLRTTHENLMKRFRKESASYVILYVDEKNPAFVLHAGDCLVGQCDADGRTTWLLQPHTLANALTSIPLATLATNSARHLLTRSFRSSSFIFPDIKSIELNNHLLLMATDGFWAELDIRDQDSFLADDFVKIDIKKR